MPGSPVLAASRAVFSPSADTLRVALGALRAGVWEWHPDDDLHLWSPEVWGLLGVRREAQAGLDAWLGSIHPDDQARICEAAVQTRLTLQAFEWSWRTHPDLGPVRRVTARGQAMPQAGQPQRMVVVLTAEALAAPPEPRMLQHILDTMPGMVSYWTPDLRLQFANQAYVRWTGRPHASLLGATAQDILPPHTYAHSRPYIERALAGEMQHFERRTANPAWPQAGAPAQALEVSYIPDIVDAKVRGMLVLAFEVTEAREAERAASQASSAKSDFLASISHEVRTPLNAMFGLAQIGARQAEGSHAQRTFEQILESAQHLLKLVNDVLDFSKIEAGKLTLHHDTVSLPHVIDQVVSLHTVQAHAKGLTLQVLEGPEVPVRFEGDGTRLAQILINLLSNAIRYTERGEVVLRIHAQGHQLCLQVSDTGVGMSKQQQQRLFQPFVQLHDDRAQHLGGTGLGLAITQRLVNLMQGHICVESSPGDGSTFKVCLPMAHAEAADWSSLGRVGLLHLTTQERQPLQDALDLRGGQAIALSQASEAALAEPPMDVVVCGSTGLQAHEWPDLRACVARGCTVIWHTAEHGQAEHGAATAPELPADLPALRIHGPLSPMRLWLTLQRRHTTDTMPTALRLQGMRVLAAEDNPINRLVMRQMLEQEGAQVTFATDGEQAIRLVQAHGGHEFDAVLCDIQMPLKDGYEATRSIHALAPDLPVIGLTANAFASARQRARECGMVDYITKPYLIDTLVHVLRQHARTQAPTLCTDPVRSPAVPFSVVPSDATEARAANLGAAPLTDFQMMKQHFTAQPLLLERLLSMLQRTLTEIDGELERALNEHRFDVLAKVAHNLKGTALNLHTPELTRLAIQAQDEARREDPNSWASGHDLLASLRHFLADMKQAQG